MNNHQTIEGQPPHGRGVVLFPLLNNHCGATKIIRSEPWPNKKEFSQIQKYISGETQMLLSEKYCSRMTFKFEHIVHEGAVILLENRDGRKPLSFLEKLSLNISLKERVHFRFKPCQYNKSFFVVVLSAEDFEE
jgi:hypothetical protein